MTDAEFQQAKAANDEAARMEKETWKKYQAYQSKLALAVNRFRIAHGGGTQVDLKYFERNKLGAADAITTVAKNPYFFADYGFTAHDAVEMGGFARDHNSWRIKHNQTSSTYWAEKERRDAEAEEKSRQSIRSKMQKSHEALASATTTPQEHKNTMVIREETDWRVSERTVDINTGEIVSVHSERKSAKGSKEKNVDSERGNPASRQSTKTTDSQAEKAAKEQERKRKKEEEKKRREAEKAEKAKKRAEDKKRRDEVRKQNRQEYDDQLAKYKKQRAEEKAAAKKKRAEEAQKRHDEYVQQRKEIAERAKQNGEADYKAVNDYTYSAVKAYEEQEANGGYKGSSAQAKKELKESLKDIWNISTASAQEELSGAYSGISSSIDTFKNAKDTVSGIYKDALSQGAGMLGNAKLTYQAALLNAGDKDAMLDIQKQILTQKLTDRMIMDQIVDNVQNQMLNFKDAGTAIRNTLLIQRAYVAAYIKQTFGNPQFVANVTKVVSLKVNNYIEAMANEKAAEINNKIDSAFTKVDGKIDKVSNQIISYLDKAEKIDIVAKMNSALDKVTSIQDRIDKKIEKFNNSPVGIFLSPLIQSVAAVAVPGIQNMLVSNKIVDAVTKVKDKIVNLQKGIAKAKEFVTQKVQMVKDYLNQLKEKAKAAVQAFANKIVADIKSKISSALGGMFAKKGASF